MPPRGNFKPQIRRNFGQVIVEAPYNDGWVAAVKYSIPHRERKYENGVWSFDPRLYGAILKITQHYYGNSILDSTGGVAEPQRSDWKERFEAWIEVEEPKWRKSQKGHKQNYDQTTDSNEEFWKRHRQRTESPSYSFNYSDRSTLFVTEDAPPEVIKAAYRVLAMKYHPDNKESGDSERMKAINAAYDSLKKLGQTL